MFAHKIKFILCRKFYKKTILNDPKTARKNLETAYPKQSIKTNYNEKFLYQAKIDLSIIVPVFNVENYISQCINSLIQKTRYLYEILLIDDGSTDGSGTICDEYAKKDSKIKVFHLKNSGVSFARNFGIIHSQGKKLMFVDSDDILEENAINTLMKNSNEFEITQGLYYKFNNQKNIVYKSKKIDLKNLNKFSKEYGFVWGKVYDRKIFENLKFPEGYWFEDMISDLIINPSHYSKKLIGKNVYFYRQNDKGITSSSKNSLKILDTYFVLEELMNNFDCFNLSFDAQIFKRFLYQASHQVFTRLRRYDEKFLKDTFILISGLTTKLLEKYKINKKDLSKTERLLVYSIENHKYKMWKDISAFFI